MNDAGFCLLWGKTIHSSIWINESKETKILWITMLALKNSEGNVLMPVVGLADSAKLTPAECRASLQVLLSPDKDDNSKVDEGRRIREIPGGWFVVNHDTYRFSTAAKREFWRITKAAQRAGRTVDQQEKFEAWEKEHPKEAEILRLKETKKRRPLTKKEKATLEALHKAQCEAMKKLDTVQKEIEAATEQNEEPT
jgi:hypothetical protein